MSPAVSSPGRSSVIGVDVGGTKIAVGIVDADARMSRIVRVPTPVGQGPAAIVAAIVEAIGALHADDLAVAGVGVSTGGIVDPRSGRILAATDVLDGWAGRSLADELSSLVQLPVTVDNDGNAFAVAQIRLGMIQGTVLCVSVGTGIGGGVVVAGRLHRGTRYAAGEYGHLPYETDRRCSCGLPGHVEAVAAGPALTEEYHRLGGRALTLPAAVQAGDPLAADVVDEGGHALGTALAGVAWALDADLVLLGGGVARVGAMLLEPLRDGLNGRLAHGRSIPVDLGRGGPDATLIGAAGLVSGWS